ncbi:S1 family peptidase [Teredinibacter purpureus]|uniref:S1 family peptidase n=1 Tax=Teredinibacter purpureus TaxID=2731756 RepID=UPI0005F83429|nr:serine protease [Teredinibacter purpureus]
MKNNIFFKTLIFLCFSLTISGFVAAETQIIGGQNAVENEFPWVAAIRIRNNNNWQTNHHCGGALISDNLVVTAAHCVYGRNASSFQVVLGEHQRSNNSGDEQVFNVRRMHRHPNYNHNNATYDLAVIELDGNATIVPGVVEIASIGNGPAEDDLVTIMGWGLTSNLNIAGQVASNILQTGEVTVLGWDACTNLRNIHNRGRQTFCGQSDFTNTCYGDSGSPVMRLNTNEIEGLVSGGSAGCTADYAFYTDFGNSWYWLQAWVDFHEDQHTASISCYTAGNAATSCSNSGSYLRGMSYYWTSSRYGMPVVYPSYGSFPYTTDNSRIIFTHSGYSSCPSGTRISLTTSFYGYPVGSDSFTCR